VLDAVTIRYMSGNKAAAKHGVTLLTLKDHLSGRVKHGTKPGSTPYLSQVEEKELTDHLLVAAKSGFGKPCKDVMNIVKRYVNQNSSHTVATSKGEIHFLVSGVEIQLPVYG